MTATQRARTIRQYLEGKALMESAAATLLAEHESTCDKRIITPAGNSTYVDGKAATTQWDRKAIESDYINLLHRPVPTCEGSPRRASVRVYAPKE